MKKLILFFLKNIKKILKLRELRIPFLNLIVILIFIFQAYVIENKVIEIGIVGESFTAILLYYTVTMYYWLPTSLYYAFTEQTKIYWLAFLINVFVTILASFTCGFFPLCFG